ncbi:MAG: hypothetical protein OIN86_07955 [Candidatus Methanoperedens sp.]|nr:hypothetical protein [Candidatus Methanoperedens sp.]CAG0975720.1 hypothetical protein METP1_01492 [Methanosarcinales archaeon]
MTNISSFQYPQASPLKQFHLSEESSSIDKKMIYTKGTASYAASIQKHQGKEMMGFISGQPRQVTATDFKGLEQLHYGIPHASIEISVWTYPKSIPIELLLVSDKLTLKNQPEQFPLSEFFINRKRVTLSKPLLLDIQLEDKRYIVSYNDLGLLAISSSRKQALQEIQEEFSELWEEYVICPENELTEGAKRLKAKLKGLVE